MRNALPLRDDDRHSRQSRIRELPTARRFAQTNTCSSAVSQRLFQCPADAPGQNVGSRSSQSRSLRGALQGQAPQSEGLGRARMPTFMPAVLR